MRQSPQNLLLHLNFLLVILSHLTVQILFKFEFSVEEAEIEIEIKEVPPTGTVGVIVAGTIASEEIKAAIVKALVLEGLSTSNITISTVADMGVLPYAALTLAKTVNIVIASSVVTHDPNGTTIYYLDLNPCN